MARKIYDPNEDSSSEVDPQLQNQSRELYTNFIREEIHLQGLQVPPDVPSLVYCFKKQPILFSNSFNLFRLDNIHFTNPLWLCNASSLRQLANEFSSSPLRAQVRSRAQSINLTTLNAQNFGEMIQEIFSVCSNFKM